MEIDERIELVDLSEHNCVSEPGCDTSFVEDLIVDQCSGTLAIGFRCNRLFLILEGT